MRFSCNRSILADVATLVGQAVSTKSTKKIFECVRLHAEGESLELAGTDLEVAVRYKLDEIQVDEAGTAVVPAALFSGVLQEIGDETVCIQVKRQKMTIETDGGKFQLEGEDPSQYPEIPEFPESSTGRMEASDVRTLVRRTTFAAGKEAARFVLNGVRLLVEEGSLRAVATDGRRLATIARPLEGVGESGTRSAIVGVKGMHYFEKIAGSASGSVELALTGRFVSLRTDRAEVTVRVLDGTFPDHGEIIPKECRMKASVPTGVFASRVRQARKFASMESQSIVLSFAPGELTISASGSEGQAEVKLGIDYEGSEEKVGFNPAYVLDALKTVESETVKLEMNDRNSAARLTDGSGFVYVLMPVIID